MNSERNRIESGSLLAVLRRAKHEELKQIVVAINKAFDVFITWDRRYIAHKDDLTRIPNVIGEYLRRAGGHAVRNLFRGGGPQYVEIVRDVCSALGVNPSPDGIVVAEEALLKELLKRALEKLSDSEKEDLLREMREAAGRPIMMEEFLQGGSALLAMVAPYIFNAIARQAAMDTLIGAGGALGIRLAPGVLGPIGVAVGIVCAVHGLAGPSLRGTIPAVAEVAFLRQRLLWGDMA